MASILLRVRNKLIYYKNSFLDNICNKTFTCSISDLIINHKFDDRILVVVSRLMDIENYYRGDKTFYYQNSLSLYAQGKRFDSETYNKNFEELILSYQKNGYNKKSTIIIDRSMYLFNGTHRTAMNIYMHCYNINASLIPRVVSVHTTYNQFQNGLPDICRDIQNRYETLREEMFREGQCFTCLINNLTSENENYKSIIHLINTYFTVFGQEEKSCGILFKLYTETPDFMIRKHAFVSRKALSLERELGANYTGLNFVLAKNSLEGKLIFEKWSKTL